MYHYYSTVLVANIVLGTVCITITALCWWPTQCWALYVSLLQHCAGGQHSVGHYMYHYYSTVLGANTVLGTICITITALCWWPTQCWALYVKYHYYSTVLVANTVLGTICITITALCWWPTECWALYVSLLQHCAGGQHSVGHYMYHYYSTVLVANTVLGTICTASLLQHCAGGQHSVGHYMYHYYSTVLVANTVLGTICTVSLLQHCAGGQHSVGHYMYSITITALCWWPTQCLGSFPNTFRNSLNRRSP